MKKFTKVLSVALVVVMMFSMMAFSPAALADGAAFGLVVKSDKAEAEIVPGAVVTVTIHFAMADWDQLMSDMRLCLVYDKSVYTPDVTTRTFLGDLAGYAKDATAAKLNDTFGQTCLTAAGASADEKALYDGGVMIQVGPDTTGLGASSKAGWSVTEEADGVSVAQISMEFTVTGDAAAIAAGTIDIKSPATVASANQYIKYTDGTNTAKQYATADADFSMANIMANMPATPTSILNPVVAQWRFHKAADGSYAGKFDVRVLAAVAKTDFETKFGATTDAQKAAIEEIGFVMAKKSVAGDSALTIDAAKALVENDTPVAGYSKVEANYISKSVLSGYYAFSAIAEDIPVAAKDDALISVAYIVPVDGDVIYYPVVSEVSFSESYDNCYNQAAAKYGW